jgi:hypothetical protein
MSFSARQFSSVPRDLGDLERERFRAAQRAEDEAERARLAKTAAGIAEREAEDRAARITAAADAYETLEPPTAEELAIKVGDLPPARQTLARVVAWIASLEKQLADTEHGRDAFLTSIGAPVVTAASLEELERSDRSGFMGWLRSGAKLAKPEIRSFEREKLQEKLKSDTYEGKIAADALTAAEDEIDTLRAQIAILVRRRDGFAKRALIEHARAAAAQYIAAARALEEKLAPLMGLASIAGGTDEHGFNAGDPKFRPFHGDAPTFQTALPSFGIAPIPGKWDAVSGKWGGRGKCEIEVDAKRVEVAAAPWKALLKLWSVNPRAKPPVEL